MYKLTHFLADQAKRQLDDRDLTSRSDLRKERKQTEEEFADLARDLCNCSKRQFERLVLPDALREVTVEARRIESAAARARALRLVRRELRSGDADAVRRQLVAIQSGTGLPSAEKQQAEQWQSRLVAEGDQGLSQFVEAYPNADRQQLRSLMKNAQKPNQNQARNQELLKQKILETLTTPAEADSTTSTEDSSADSTTSTEDSNAD